MLTLEQLRGLLAHPNVTGMLRCIREQETDQTERAYRRVNGRPDFSDFSAHPFGRLPTTQGGHAAGAYQFLPTTWAGLTERYGFTDFSPPTQDLGAVALMADRGALPDVLAGRFAQAVARLRATWSSLPGASEASRAWTLERAQAVYQQWGGTLDPDSDTQPAAPIEDDSTQASAADAATAQAADQRSTMGDEGPQFTLGGLGAPSLMGVAQGIAGVVGVFNPLIGGLASALIQAFAPLAQEKIAHAINRHSGDHPEIGQQVATVLVNKAIELTGKLDPVEATVAARNDPQVLQQLEDHTLDFVDKLKPWLDKLGEMDEKRWAADRTAADAAGARGRLDTVDIAPRLIRHGNVLFIVALVGLLGVLAVQMYFADDHKPDGVLIALLTILVYAVARMEESPFRYRFGGQHDSAAADTSREAIVASLPKGNP